MNFVTFLSVHCWVCDGKEESERLVFIHTESPTPPQRLFAEIFTGVHFFYLQQLAILWLPCLFFFCQLLCCWCLKTVCDFPCVCAVVFRRDVTITPVRQILGHSYTSRILRVKRLSLAETADL